MAARRNGALLATKLPFYNQSTVAVIVCVAGSIKANDPLLW